MVPDGRIIARAHWAEAPPSPLSSVLVVGDDLRFWYPDEGYTDDLPEFALRHAQLFGAGTARRLRRLTIGVVGCSGTGSIVIELLARLDWFFPDPPPVVTRLNRWRADTWMDHR